MVYLIGAGPGDPGLITVKGLEFIKQCDTIIYDRLGTYQLLEMVKPDCRRIYVGKQAGSQGNLLTLKSARVTAAIPFLMVRVGDFLGIGKERDGLLQCLLRLVNHLTPHRGVRLHDLEFLGCQLARFEKNAIRYSHFANVVQGS